MRLTVKVALSVSSRKHDLMFKVNPFRSFEVCQLPMQTTYSPTPYFKVCRSKCPIFSQLLILKLTSKYIPFNNNHLKNNALASSVTINSDSATLYNVLCIITQTFIHICLISEYKHDVSSTHPSEYAQQPINNWNTILHPNFLLLRHAVQPNTNVKYFFERIFHQGYSHFYSESRLY